ncbi:MAG: MipA/OmpV family protein [Holophaga sp.]|nr:MipA/OmpV family protein [Holophaga sp.]
MPKNPSSSKPGRTGRSTRAVLQRALVGLGCGLAALPAAAQAAPAELPPPQLEVGIGLTSTPGWLGDNRQVVHGTAWVNAEYTTQYYGRFQVNGGSLTTDPSVNWDPWVKGIASFGFMMGYHGNSAMGEGHSPQIPGTAQGLDVGVQAVVSIFGAPLFIQARKALPAEQGWITVVGSYLPIHPTKELTVAFLPTARWYDKQQSQLCFNGPAPQDGSAPYGAESGFQDVSLEVVVDWQFTQHFHWVSTASERWLTGSAAKTPWTRSIDQTGYFSGVSYHF